MYDSRANEINTQTSNGYKIGAVSRITGIPVDRLRIWERRYAVVEPARTPSHGRVYNEQQVDKLRLIKKLIDKGDRIGSVANLSMEDLEYRLSVFADPEDKKEPSSSKTYRICALGKSLKLQLQANIASTQMYEIESVYSRQSEFEDHVRVSKPEILLIECAGLVESKIRNIESLMELSKARVVVILYSFSSDQLIKHQSDDNWIFLKAPLNASKLRETLMSCCQNLEPQTNPAVASKTEPEERIFTEQQLFQISKESSAIKCECPQHLSFIIKKLVDFEEYSQSCVVDSVEDSLLHKELYIETAKARTIMEKALKHLVEVEGIEY